MSCLVGTESPTCVATEATPAPQRADASPKRRKRLSVATTPPRKPCQGNAAPQQVAAKIAYTAAPGAGERAGIVVFSRFVEVGRVVLINYGPGEGKLATIIDIVDGNKCLRVAHGHRVKIPKNARQKTLNKAWDGADVLAKWDASSWAKKLAAKKKRASLTDFQRFQLMVAPEARSAIVAAKVKES
ncbi:ribosomal protein L14 [Aureococcus anophagefferens]|uniref:Ribosomal protein L14 n=1 Tax=Aureococcus anophagefferens TaxID=44056 RepID=A0ABR1FN55_AURAN